MGVAAAPPDGTYNYSITQSGSQIGTSTVIVKRVGSDVTVHETETLGTLSFVIDEVLDSATLNPKTYVASYTKDTYTQTARGSFDRSGATVSFDGVPGTQVFPLSTRQQERVCPRAVAPHGLLHAPGADPRHQSESIPAGRAE